MLSEEATGKYNGWTKTILAERAAKFAEAAREAAQERPMTRGEMADAADAEYFQQEQFEEQEQGL